MSVIFHQYHKFYPGKNVDRENSPEGNRILLRNKGVMGVQSSERVRDLSNMKKRSLAGTCGVGVFLICFVTIVIAFSTPRWLVSDQRITSAKLDGLGLWVHCFRSLPDVKDDFQRRFFVGCRWVYDPFTTGYDEIRGFLLPAFMIVTQFFYTLCLIGALVGLVLVLLFFLCAGPDLSWYVLLIRSTSWLLLATGICGSLGVIVFACFGNRNNWMPEHANNWFGWSFGLAVVGAVTALIASALFFTELHIQEKKVRQFKESQSRFEMHEGK